LPNPAFPRSPSLSFVFLWTARLSFVYESKEKMRHEQHAGKKKTLRKPEVKQMKINSLMPFSSLLKPSCFFRLQFFIDSQTAKGTYFGLDREDRAKCHS